MKKFLILFLLLPGFIPNAQELSIKKGMKITKSVKIRKATYKIDAIADLKQPVIVIEGKNIIIDFNNAILKGSNSKKLPDEFFGLAIIIRNSKNVTVKNLNAKGYKVALMVRNTESLLLENCDLSYNYRPKLNSTQEKEDISDWMSYHHNEKDEWLRYGAAIYLRSCNSFTIKNCKVTGGQNALMMTECNDGMIYNNDFSFNSGIGIGMYRSSRNNVMYNRVIFNVRGYSHGVYNRGQDSAGILVYEQSNNNLFYKNNVTHGGDGFFLWAGQTTMDTGKGGCNDNILMGNDFSYAPTNGVEVTFSRNKIIDNRMYECDHGIWGGYSYESDISNNKFRNNRIGIAIEHGQQNRLSYNLFYKDKEAIRLWARSEQPADWGYAKYRDTKSRDYEIVSNSFNVVPLVFNLNRTHDISVFNNRFIECDNIFKIDSTVTDLDTTVNDELADELSEDPLFKVPAVAKPNDPFKGVASLAGRKNILITEWGPYDFQFPLIWNTNPTDTSGNMEFDILGPKGRWKFISLKGVEINKMIVDTFPNQFSAKEIPADRTDIEIVAEYSGPAFIDQFGNRIPANTPYRFAFKKYFQPINWNVLWFSMDTAFHNPIMTDQLFAPNVRMRPIKSDTTNKIDYAWWGGLKGEDGEQYKQFITTADGQAEIPQGEYELGVTWDDAVRVYLDGKLILDEWNPSLYTFDESPHKKIKLKLGGNHYFRLEHLELGGFATLSLKLKKID